MAEVSKWVKTPEPSDKSCGASDLIGAIKRDLSLCRFALFAAKRVSRREDIYLMEIKSLIVLLLC